MLKALSKCEMSVVTEKVFEIFEKKSGWVLLIVPSVHEQCLMLGQKLFLI